MFVSMLVDLFKSINIGL